MTAERYDPKLYALLHRGTPGDERFYERACQGASSVLELGCGYGRLIPALVRTGAHYQGLDIDAGLLTLARRVRLALPTAARARVALRRGDMREFRFRRRFDRILIPHAGLYCLRTQAEVLACFARVREQLSETGELVLDAYVADGFHADLEPADMTGAERDWLSRVEGSDGRYEIFERTRWLKRAQVLDVIYEYHAADGVRREGRIRHRYLLRPQLEALLARAGFQVTELSGNFSGGRLTKRSGQLVVRARPLSPEARGKRG